MTDLKQTRDNPIKQFWDELDNVHAGMLGVEGAGQHMQPMAPMADPDSRSIWFYTRTDSDLVQSLGASAWAHFVVIGDDHDYHACVAGDLARNLDPARRDRFWNPMVGAWFDGKDDPALTMLQLKLSDGVVWASASNPVRFGWEMVKANLTDEEPDVGVRKHIRFS